jgi:glycosyltransferase involved in cell wall biosynthesis
VKIAVYHNLPSGGAKRALYEMTRRLAERHTPDVFALATAEHDFCDLRSFANRHEVVPFKPLPLAHSPLGRLNQGIRALDLLRLRHVQREIARRIDSAGYDCVFVHHCRYGQSPSLLQFLNTPSVYYCHEPPRLFYEPPVPRPYTEFSPLQSLGNRFDPLPGIYRRTLARLDRENVRAASRVLTNSHYSRETLYRTYGIFAHVAYLGVDTEKFRPLGLTRENFVLSVGALNPRKGFDFLIESLALLPEGQRLPLVIVSNFADSAEKAYLEALAQQLQVVLEIKVMVPDTELVQLYNRARAVLYAPVMEPFGFVPLEAGACGTPVVGVREAGIRESILHEQTGLLTERDPREFAAAIAQLLNDADQCERWGVTGRQCVTEHWTWAQACCDLEDQLQSAASCGEVNEVLSGA